MDICFTKLFSSILLNTLSPVCSLPGRRALVNDDYLTHLGSKRIRPIGPRTYTQYVMNDVVLLYDSWKGIIIYNRTQDKDSYMMPRYFFLLSLFISSVVVESFQPVHHRPTISTRQTSSSSSISTTTTTLMATSLNESELKSELTEYLKKRDESNADEAAKA